MKLLVYQKNGAHDLIYSQFDTEPQNIAKLCTGVKEEIYSI